MYKALLFTLCLFFTYAEYRVIYKPETMLRPPKYGARDYGPLPGYMLNRMIGAVEPKVIKVELKLEKPENKKEVIPQKRPRIMPFPGQTEEEQVTMTVDLDELYLKDPVTCVKTVVGYFILLGMELAVIGYVFGYPIYLDRIEYAKLYKEEQKVAAKRLERKRRKVPRRRTKRN